MGYAKQAWADGVVGNTPLNAARLGHLEDGIGNEETDRLAADTAHLAAVDPHGDRAYADSIAGSGGGQLFARYADSTFPITMTDPRIVCQDNVDGGPIVSFPWLAKDGTTLLCTYGNGGDTVGSGVKTTMLKKSVDNGATWTTGVVAWDEGISPGACIAVLANGNYIISSQTYSGATMTGVKGKISTNKGTSWGTTFDIAAGYYTSSAPFPLANGTDIIQACYSSGIVHLYVSTNGGTTWSVRNAAMISGNGASEVTFQQLPNGTIVALVRCTDWICRRTTSTNNGVTWSTPTALFTDCDARVDWVRMDNGRSIGYYREKTSASGYMRYSDDDFATYSASQRVHGPDKRTSYGAMVQIMPGVCFGLQGELEGQDVTTTEITGRIFGRFFIDGQGLAPTGQTTYRPAIVRARGEGNVVAYDTFSRPTTLYGLGSSDSGHQWVEYGGTTSNQWNIYSGNSARSTSLTIRPSTINAGTEDGFIEADTYWQGSAANMGLVARRSTVNNHCFVTAFNATGTLSYLYYTPTGVDTFTLLHTSSAISVDTLVWFHVKLIVKGHSIKYYIDDQLVNVYIMSSTDFTNTMGSSNYGWGITGGGTSGNTHHFDNVVISGDPR